MTCSVFPFHIARLGHELGDTYIAQKGRVLGKMKREIQIEWFFSTEMKKLLKLKSQMYHHVFYVFFLVAAVIQEAQDDLIILCLPGRRV